MTPCRKCRYNLDTQIGFRTHLIVCRVPQKRWPEEYAQWSATQAVSGEASSPASPDLVEVDGAGSASSPEAALHAQACDCGWAGKSLAKHRAKAHREVVA